MTDIGAHFTSIKLYLLIKCNVGLVTKAHEAGFQDWNILLREGMNSNIQVYQLRLQFAQPHQLDKAN